MLNVAAGAACATSAAAVPNRKHLNTVFFGICPPIAHVGGFERALERVYSVRNNNFRSLIVDLESEYLLRDARESLHNVGSESAIDS